MKKISLTLLVFCFAIAAAVAQKPALFHGGGYAGISTSQLSGDQLSGFKKVGIYAGAFVNIHLTPKSLLQLEISYIQKGSRAVSKTVGLVYHVNLQYFEAPLLYRWQFSNRFGLEAGPAAAFLVKNTNIERDYLGILPNRPAFNRLDLSVVGGVSVKIVEHFKTNVRFTQSVLPVRPHASGAVYRLNRGQYNSVISLIFVAEF